MTKRSFSVILFILLTLQTFAQAKQIKFEDARRRYLIYLPQSYQKNSHQQYPVVFNFHGGGMTMTEQMFYSGMNKAADKNHFIVVYPQGINQDWNVGFETSYQFGSNDVGFVDTLLNQLIKQYRVDESAVYATGLSRGGFFCHRLATELPHRFAAIAPIGAPIPDSVAYFNKKNGKVSMLLIQGTTDEIVKYEGKDGAYKSALNTYKYWKKINSLENHKESKRVINPNKKDSTSINILETNSEVSVGLISIINGGHTWPGSDPFNIGFSLGNTSQDIDANEIIWQFFSRHKRK